jgi:AcrR family transcriptional regulator
MRRKEGDKGGDILRAAVSVFSRDGFDGAKVSTIAAEAGVATGSVYLYFTGKDDILDGLFREFWDNLRDAIVRIDLADPLDRIRRQLELFYDRLVADRRLARVYLHDHHRFLARRPRGFESYQDCLGLGDKAFREASGAVPEPEILSLSYAILFGGVRAALEYALDRPETETESVKKHMLTMAVGSLRVLIEGEKG